MSIKDIQREREREGEGEGEGERERESSVYALVYTILYLFISFKI